MNITQAEINEWYRNHKNEDVSNRLLVTPSKKNLKKIINEVDYWSNQSDKPLIRQGYAYYTQRNELEKRVSLANYEVVLERQGPNGKLVRYAASIKPISSASQYSSANQFGSQIRRINEDEFKKQTLLNRAINYGAIDEYVNWDNIVNGRLDKIAQGVLLYPIDAAIDIGIRSPKAIFYDIPVEALRRTKIKRETRERMIQQADNGFVKLLLAPIHLAQNTVDFSVNYGIIAVEGMAEKITQRPLETAMHGLLGYWLYDILKSDNGSKHVSVAENLPPLPEFPTNGSGGTI